MDSVKDVFYQILRNFETEKKCLESDIATLRRSLIFEHIQTQVHQILNKDQTSPHNGHAIFFLLRNKEACYNEILLRRCQRLQKKRSLFFQTLTEQYARNNTNNNLEELLSLFYSYIKEEDRLCSLVLPLAVPPHCILKFINNHNNNNMDSFLDALWDSVHRPSSTPYDGFDTMFFNFLEYIYQTSKNENNNNHHNENNEDDDIVEEFNVEEDTICFIVKDDDDNNENNNNNNNWESVHFPIFYSFFDDLRDVEESETEENNNNNNNVMESLFDKGEALWNVNIEVILNHYNNSEKEEKLLLFLNTLKVRFLSEIIMALTILKKQIHVLIDSDDKIMISHSLQKNVSLFPHHHNNNHHEHSVPCTVLVLPGMENMQYLFSYAVGRTIVQYSQQQGWFPLFFDTFLNPPRHHCFCHLLKVWKYIFQYVLNDHQQNVTAEMRDKIMNKILFYNIHSHKEATMKAYLLDD